MMVIFAPEGSEVNGREVKKVKVAGEWTSGIICGPMEMCWPGDASQAIAVRDSSEVGDPAPAALGGGAAGEEDVGKAENDMPKAHSPKKAGSKKATAPAALKPDEACPEEEGREEHDGMKRKRQAPQKAGPPKRNECGSSEEPAGDAYVFDMETGDPDDVLTLLFLCSRPGVDLRAVTLTPGTAEQVALVRWILQQLGLARVRLGAQRWVAQGGFAGEGVVPEQRQLDKFRGLRVCPTWNFCGNVPAARAALKSPAIERKICVSKNVCHATVYDYDWHRALEAAVEAEAGISTNSRRGDALGMMHRVMDGYLRHKPGGKKLHDPLALAVALDESVCELAEVRLFCEKGQWGSYLSSGSNTWISVAYDEETFRQTLLWGGVLRPRLSELKGGKVAR